MSTELYTCGHARSVANTYVRPNGIEHCRICISAASRARYALKKDHILAVSRAWQDANPERCRANRLAWDAAHPEVSKRRHAVAYAKNPEHYRENRYAWAAANPEKVLASAKKFRDSHPTYVKDWKDANRDHVNMAHRVRTHMLRGAGILTEEDWVAVLEEFGSRCLACFSTAPVTIDHVIPIIKGGANSVSNVQPLCQPCNSKKYVKIIDYRHMQSQFGLAA